MSDLLAATTLWHREVVRFRRQPARVLGAVGMPLLFWALIGSGLSGSFRLPGGPEDLDYLEYFFPGTIVMLVLFAAIFSTFSVIDDRNEGFLQGVLVAPVRRSALVAGKVFGGATLAWIQGMLFLVLAPVAGIRLTLRSGLEVAVVVAVMAVALTAFGFAFAWRMNSTQGFHAVMNLVLMPMWFLSGAIFPLSGAPGWLDSVMRLNPLTYGTAALRRVLYGDTPLAGQSLPSLGLSLTVMLIWAAAALAVDVWLVRRTASP
ncbi:MAG: ABC transporter permease [Thermoanaerobaculia bacterium]